MFIIIRLLIDSESGCCKTKVNSQNMAMVGRFDMGSSEIVVLKSLLVVPGRLDASSTRI